MTISERCSKFPDGLTDEPGDSMSLIAIKQHRILHRKVCYVLPNGLFQGVFAQQSGVSGKQGQKDFHIFFFSTVIPCACMPLKQGNIVEIHALQDFKWEQIL